LKVIAHLDELIQIDTNHFDIIINGFVSMRNKTIDKLIEDLSNQVEVNNPKSIKLYLSRFKQLIDLLPTAVGIARKHFPEARIVLDVYLDPEIKDSYIVLYIRLRQYEDSFIERLSIAEKELLPLLVNKKFWIQLSTDFE
jgi:hypothetical protein